MTTKPKARKFRIRRTAPLGAPVSATSAARGASAPADAAATPAARVRPPSAGSDGAAAGAGPARVVPPAAVNDTAQPGATPAPPRGAGSASPHLTKSAVPPAQIDSAKAVAAESDMDALRQEGLTGRQLRMARRVAQKHGLAVTSDFDAVRQLRSRGIDPFQRSNILELVVPGETETVPNANSGVDGVDGVEGTPLGRIQLPQTVSGGRALAPAATERKDPALLRATEIAGIQRDMARRRRRKGSLLFSRLAIFVLIPTILVGYYFYALATPMFSTKSEFVIQQAESQSAGGLGGLFAGTSAATQQDSTTVQSYLTSRAALARLDADHGFREHFSQEDIDAIQRLPADATNEEMFGVYSDRVRISYDPTEGIVRMEVIAADPATSQVFSEALIGYAEEQVDQLTRRLRDDQMAGARNAYEEAEGRRTAALASLLDVQRDVQQIDPVGETTARIQQISALESQRQQLQLSLQSRLSVSTPNQAQVADLRNQIDNVDTLIADLRAGMTAGSPDGNSLASNNTELRLAEENYAFQTIIVQQALQQMETARLEANRQVRYLSMGVAPVAPDQAAYPRAFENTAIAFLILAGIYLMISLTASILREQVSN